MYRTSGDGNVEYILEELFSKENLTSDTEPEELLFVERKKVQEYWDKIKKLEPTAEPFDRKAGYLGQLKALVDFFGSKCLPDKEKQAKPFRVGDRVKIVNVLNPMMQGEIGIIVEHLTKDSHLYKVKLCEDSESFIEDCYLVEDRYLEPYTEEKNDMEEKELNLCELLKDCVYENFYSPICGKCEYKESFEDSETMLFEAVKEEEHGGHQSLIFDAEGRNNEHGICLLFPSKDLYEKYPLDAYSAWMEWAESRKSKYNVKITLSEGKEDKYPGEYEVQFNDLKEAQQAAKEARKTLESFYHRKEGEK